MSSVGRFTRLARPPSAASRREPPVRKKQRPASLRWAFLLIARILGHDACQAQPATQTASAPALEITNVSPSRDIALVSGGREHGLVIGDRAEILRGGRLVAAGEIFYLEPRQAALRTVELGSRPQVADTVILLPRDGHNLLKCGALIRLNLSADVGSVAPGGRWAWLAGGQRQGWQVGDTLLILRGNLPLACGRIDRVSRDAALVRVHRVPAAAHAVGPGDRAERISSSDSACPRWVTRLTQVTPGESAQDLLLAAIPDCGIAIGDRFDVFRGHEYVGFARVVSLLPDAVLAEAEESFCAAACRPGDLAVRRLPAELPAARAGVLFRVEGDYALASLGEADGIQVGDRLLLRGDPADALTVDAVYPDHCGLRAPSRPGAPMSLRRWDFVTPQDRFPPMPCLSPTACRPSGADWLLTCTLDPQGTHAPPGTVVTLAPPDGRVGVLLDSSHGTLVVDLLDAWYALPGLTGPPQPGRE